MDLFFYIQKIRVRMDLYWFINHYLTSETFNDVDKINNEDEIVKLNN